MGLLQQHFALAKSFLQSLAKSLHKQDAYDGLPMVLSILLGSPCLCHMSAVLHFVCTDAFACRHLQDSIAAHASICAAFACRHLQLQIAVYVTSRALSCGLGHIS